MSLDITVRRGRPEDVPALQSFTRNTFEWGDYVADALSEWLNEPGDLWVAEAAGKPVGVNHVRYLSPDETWFEGIRVHPDYRRLGIGKRLTEAAIRGAKERGAKIARISIDDDNFRSQGMSQSAGFVLVDEIIDLHKDLPAGETPASEGELDENAVDVVTVVAACPSDAAPLAKEASKSLAYVGCDYTWRKVSEESILANLTNGVRVMIAKEAGGAVRGGTWFGSFFVEPDNQKGGVMTVMAELGSIFGDESAVRALVQWAETTLARKRDRDGLPAAKLFVNCRKSLPTRSILPTLGFCSEEHKHGLWELDLLEARSFRPCSDLS